MAWMVGIDEAGYGPNLGPFVMSAVAVRMPSDEVDGDPWDMLGSTVRRHSERDDGERLLVADSKLVYASSDGLLALELAVHALLGPDIDSAFTFGKLIDSYSPDAHAALQAEAWYTGKSRVPSAECTATLGAVVERVRCACQAAGIAQLAVRSVVVCTPQFNDIVDEVGSKGAVLGHALCRLLAWLPEGDDGASPLSYCIDKHGGRNHYAALVQHGVGDGMVVAMEEGRERSSYRVLGLPRPITLTFMPRADTNHFCVALASMASKYLRELLMVEFNEFWRKHVPGIKPTAGYPGDATRFFEAIRPAAERLGISVRKLWRSR